MNEYHEFLHRVVNHAGGCSKLAICAAGAGVSISDILKIPGASAAIHGIYLPYAVEDTAHFLQSHLSTMASSNFMEKSVTASVAADLDRALMNKYRYSADFIATIGITGALTTSRYRHGENKAFIQITTKKEKILATLTFPKLPESIYTDTVQNWSQQVISAKREKEDQAVARVALALAYDIDEDYLLDLARENVLVVCRSPR